MIEFIYEPSQGVAAEQIREEAIVISQRAFRSVVPDIEMNSRQLDTNELANINASLLPDGAVDLHQYMRYQARDRRIYGIPESTKAAILLSGRTCVILDGRRSESPFGYSVGPVGEAAVSTDSIYRKTPSMLQPFASRLIAYTTVHEIGHQFGLVNVRAARHRTGNHCGNICVMATTSTTQQTLNLLDRMPDKLPCFCRKCKRDIKASAH